MPINAGHEYFEAERNYAAAQTLDERIIALEELIRKAPKHKSSENLLAELKTRLRKFKEKSEKARKMGGGKKGIKKEGYQVVLVGLPSSGKSSLLAALTNARPAISPYPFTTKWPELGTMDYFGVKAQIVDTPSLGSGSFDIGLVNTADCILLVVDKMEDVSVVEKHLSKTVGKRIIVFTKIDSLSNEELRKLDARCKSKRLHYVLVSGLLGMGVDNLKQAIFDSMNCIRVYTKEPGKPSSQIPILLPHGSIVKDVAESILKGFSLRVKETRVTGPSAKFVQQKIGLSHVLKDRDVVEFHTR